MKKERFPLSKISKANEIGMRRDFLMSVEMSRISVHLNTSVFQYFDFGLGYYKK